MSTKRVLKAVSVEWADACSSAEWLMWPEAFKEKVAVVTSVGFLLSGGRKNQDVKLAGSVGDDEVMGVLTIPSNWIMKVTPIPGVTAIMKDDDDA